MKTWTRDSLINWPNIPQTTQNLSAQIDCPHPKVWDFDEKGLHWASVVRGFGNLVAFYGTYIFSLQTSFVFLKKGEKSFGNSCTCYLLTFRNTIASAFKSSNSSS